MAEIKAGEEESLKVDPPSSMFWRKIKHTLSSYKLINLLAVRQMQQPLFLACVLTISVMF